jgi:hypothetical protein
VPPFFCSHCCVQQDQLAIESCEAPAHSKLTFESQKSHFACCTPCTSCETGKVLRQVGTSHNNVVPFTLNPNRSFTRFPHTRTQRKFLKKAYNALEKLTGSVVAFLENRIGQHTSGNTVATELPTYLRLLVFVETAVGPPTGTQTRSSSASSNRK